MEVVERIERLARERRQMTPADQLRALVAIRVAAQAGGCGAVVSLAHALHAELLAVGHAAPFGAYLDRMLDAVDVTTDDQPRFVDLALATLGARLAFA